MTDPLTADEERMTRRVDVHKILADPASRARLVDGVVRFCCAHEGHVHSGLAPAQRTPDD